MPDFTPGEWKCSQDGEYPIQIVACGENHYSPEIEICELTKIPKILKGATISEIGTMDANARLIAAAPNMYRLLERILGILEQDHSYAGFHLKSDIERLFEFI